MLALRHGDVYEDAEVVAVLGGGELKVAFTADQSSTPDSQQDARTQPTPSGVAADTYDGHGTAKPVVVQQPQPLLYFDVGGQVAGCRWFHRRSDGI